MVRIAHLTTVHQPLDARIFHKEAKALRQHGYDVSVIAQGTRSFTRDGIRIIPIRPSTSRVGRVTLTAYSMLAASLRVDADIYHLHDPELIPLGFLLRLRGKAVIYDAHEDLPHDVAAKEWIPRRLRPIVAQAATIALRAVGAYFSGIVASVDAVAARFPKGRAV
ncbi:MAG: glycosyltransferase, partial [Candidatus Eremiobacteraeota bacterium]|nr:glycosyltransferase [Candidatus Eremiobacteraeota bacterium]